ncbi:guanylate kinase [Marinivivus vitaminiproducens]|uniref:guanylate kinase n=1 Tax=Marinivivus vitaminiproducens TaxID=3035935 RepID=UPI0027A5B649|nr:guanylate kinase [Geminicoccaceae bacterium SCSIO 64248]
MPGSDPSADTEPAIKRRGLMLVVSSPSGAGKTTITRGLLESDPDLRLSISVTTRERRPAETEGVHYYFTDDAGFEAMAQNGELLEHARVYGHRYGTPRAPVEAALNEGKDVLFDIDWQGAQQIREAAREDMVGLFILPPSVPVLAQRLRTRAQDSEAEVTHRLAQVGNDVTHWSEYDYVLVNADLDKSLASVRAILTAERLRRNRQVGLGQFVKQFRAQS